VERLQTKVPDEVARDWEFFCIGCGKIAFSMASASKALYCRHCQADLVPIWFPINVPRYAVPRKFAVQCPHCWETLVVNLPPGKVPFGKTSHTCRHCLGKGTVNFRKRPIALQKAGSKK
jgi:hypothetical protein